MKRSRFSEEQIESFNEKFCDECLSQSWHTSLEDARQGIEAWRMDYNTVRPHSSLGYLMPEEYAAIPPPDRRLPSTPVVCVAPVWEPTDLQERRSANL